MYSVEFKIISRGAESFSFSVCSAGNLGLFCNSARSEQLVPSTSSLGRQLKAVLNPQDSLAGHVVFC